MRPLSDPTRWAEALARSHRTSVEATILPDGPALPVKGGTVTLDSRAEIRGRLDLAVADDGTLVPTVATDPLTPYGNEISVERGLAYGDGTVERVGLGVFGIEVVEPLDDGLIRITGQDRARKIQRARFEEPYQVAAGTNYGDAIEAVLIAADPFVVTDFDETSLTTPALFAESGDDPWVFAQRMAAAIGMELYFDGDGVAVLRPVSQLGANPAVAAFAEGPGGVLIAAPKTWTREGTFNRVIATGENSGQDDVSRGVATDTDPASPTQYGGQFGKVPRFYVSPFIGTDAQAADAAAAILSRELGTTQQINFETIVNPALEPGDVVTVTRLATGIEDDFILDQMVIPLSAEGAMSGVTREVVV